MDGGSIAKKNLRYQDLCALYFALKCYYQEPSLFEQVYCEQDKLDFEVWKNDSFLGYQVKNQEKMLSAKEVNGILKYYLRRSSDSTKDVKSFWFIFSHKPKNSLHQLLHKLSGSGGVWYHKKTEEYIDIALDGLMEDDLDLVIDYECFTYDEIQDMSFGIARRVIKRHIGASSDVYTDVIEYFLRSLRDSIDEISGSDSSDMRFYSFQDIDTLIKRFMGNISVTDYSNQGEQKEVRSVEPQKVRVMRPPLVPQASATTQAEGRAVKEKI